TAAVDLEATILSVLLLLITQEFICAEEREENQPFTHSTAIHSHYGSLVSSSSPPVSLIINHSRTQHFTNDSLSLSCEDQSNSTGWTVRRYTHSERVLDFSVWGSVTGSTCNISFLSTSYTGVYWCESESGENSNPVNITVHVSRSSHGTVGVAVGLSLVFLFVVFLIFMILTCYYKINKGEAAAESREVTDTQVTKKKKTNRNNGADAEPGVDDVTYANLEIKPMKKTKRMKGTHLYNST
ncbi:hypothetical protein AMELA_G00058250, partial [Ameiurus melas]